MKTVSQQLDNIIEDYLNHYKELWNSVGDYVIEIGVISQKTKRTQSVGISNAELMFIHENGSPKRNIPARPVLDYTLQYANNELLTPTLNKIYDGIFNHEWSKADIEKELNKMCIRMQSYAQSMIRDRDPRLAPNKPATIKAKKSDLPLLDTGQLSRSITCHLVLTK